MTWPSRAELIDLVRRSKAMATRPGWRRKQPGKPSIEARFALVENGVTIPGLTGYARCTESLPDERLSIGLIYGGLGKQRTIARVDWREGTPHPNVHGLCGPRQFISATESHFHCPSHYDPSINPQEYLDANLPSAEALDPPPSDLVSFLHICATLLNVTDLDQLKAPPWQTSAL